jgi:DNA modification methylase
VRLAFDHWRLPNVLPELSDGSVDFVPTDPPYPVNYRDRTGRSLSGDDSGHLAQAGLFPNLSGAESWRLLRRLLRLE